MRKGHRIGKRRKGIHWDYNWDGCYSMERWNKWDKQYWNKWRRREGKKELQQTDW